MTSTSSDHRNQLHCFKEWMILQELDLSEMLQALNVKEDAEGDKDLLLRQLVRKNIEHFQTYADQRTRLARDHVSPLFAPTWCSSLECSLLWLSGCRPSLFIRLVYALSGLEIETHLMEFLEGPRRSSELGELSLSATQLTMINKLQSRTIKEEEKLSNEMASLQEKIADQPIALISQKASRIYSEQNVQLDEALDEHDISMVKMLQEADKLRLQTLKELVNILSPVQAVDFLAAGKKLHLCMHEWGNKRDRLHG